MSVELERLEPCWGQVFICAYACDVPGYLAESPSSRQLSVRTTITAIFITLDLVVVVDDP